MNFKTVLALPKTTQYKSKIFIWIVWSTLYVHISLSQPRKIKIIGLFSIYVSVIQRNQLGLTWVDHKQLQFSWVKTIHFWQNWVGSMTPIWITYLLVHMYLKWNSSFSVKGPIIPLKKINIPISIDVSIKTHSFVCIRKA